MIVFVSQSNFRRNGVLSFIFLVIFLLFYLFMNVFFTSSKDIPYPFMDLDIDVEVLTPPKNYGDNTLKNLYTSLPTVQKSQKFMSYKSNGSEKLSTFSGRLFALDEKLTNDIMSNFIILEDDRSNLAYSTSILNSDISHKYEFMRSYDTTLLIASPLRGTKRLYVFLFNLSKADRSIISFEIQEPQRVKDIKIYKDVVAVLLDDNTVNIYHEREKKFSFKLDFKPKSMKLTEHNIVFSSAGKVSLYQREQNCIYSLSVVYTFEDKSFGKCIDLNESYLSIQGNEEIYIYYLGDPSKVFLGLRLPNKYHDFLHKLGEKTILMYNEDRYFLHAVQASKNMTKALEDFDVISKNLTGKLYVDIKRNELMVSKTSSGAKNMYDFYTIQ